MQVSPRDRVLELDCGEGAMSVRLAGRALEGMVSAMDPSEDQVGRARAHARDLDNVMFTPGGAAEIPWKEAFFSKALSHGLPRELAGVLRVLVSGGLYYVAGSEPIPTEWKSRLEAAGFTAVEEHHLGEQLAVLVARKPTP